MDLGRVLGNTQPLDVKELLKALQLTIEFEGQLSKRYEKMVMISFYIHERFYWLYYRTSMKIWTSRWISKRGYLHALSLTLTYTLMHRTGEIKSGYALESADLPNIGLWMRWSILMSSRIAEQRMKATWWCCLQAWTCFISIVRLSYSVQDFLQAKLSGNFLSCSLSIWNPIARSSWLMELHGTF